MVRVGLPAFLGCWSGCGFGSGRGERSLRVALLVEFLGGNGAEGGGFAAIEQLHTAVEVAAHEDLVFGFWQGFVVFEDLVVAVFVANTPVVLEHAVFLEAEDVVELNSLGQGTVVVFFFERGLGEFLVEEVAKTVFK